MPRSASLRRPATRAGPCTRPGRSPSFGGDFLPAERAGHATRASTRPTGSAISRSAGRWSAPAIAGSTTKRAGAAPRDYAQAQCRLAARPRQISLIQPVDLYSQVNRATKYGFLFIGFTFLALLMFDVIGGVRVSAVEYLLMGAALVLFFVLLLAFAEVIGFTAAYVARVGGDRRAEHGLFGGGAQSWRRAAFIGALARRPLCRALHPAQPRGLLAADRLAAAVRGAGRGDVRDAPASTGAPSGKTAQAA